MLVNGTNFIQFILSAKQQELEILKKNVDILFLIIMGNLSFVIIRFLFHLIKTLFKKSTVNFDGLATRIRFLWVGSR